MNKHPFFLPHEIHFIKNQAFVISNFSQNPEIMPGMQVESINGLSINEIKNKVELCIPSDGFNITSKTFEMNTDFPQVYSLFFGNNAKFNIEFVDAFGKIINMKVNGQNPDSIALALQNKYPNRFPNGQFPASFQINEESKIAILYIKGFWAPDWEQFNAFFHSSVEKINKENIRYLIVDVRGNKGGHPYFAAELLSYLAKEDFTYFELPQEKGDLAPLFQPLKIKDDSFNGEVFILMDGGCLSTTGHFLSLIKYHQIGTMIGEESGGSFYCNDGSLQYELPNTKIRLNLPQTTFQTAVKGFAKGEPLLPDYYVSPSLDDILIGKDAELEFAFQLISF